MGKTLPGEPMRIANLQQCPHLTSRRKGTHHPPDSLDGNPEERADTLSPRLTRNRIHTNAPHYRPCILRGLLPEIPTKKLTPGNGRGSRVHLWGSPRRHRTCPPTLPPHTRSTHATPVCGWAATARLAMKNFRQPEEVPRSTMILGGDTRLC
jgi:hypothetical protein